MKTTICRVLQILLLGLYTIGVLIVVLGAIGIATTLMSSLWMSADIDLTPNLAAVGLGAILTFAARNAEKLLVSILQPQNDNFVALLEKPVSDFFAGKHKN